MVRLCWIAKKNWNYPYGGLPHSTSFDTIDELKSVMSKCRYNGEWVEDEKGNRLEIDLKQICFS